MAVETDIWLGDALKAWDRLAPGPGEPMPPSARPLPGSWVLTWKTKLSPPPSTNGTAPDSDFDHTLSNAPNSPGIEPEQTPSSRKPFEPSPPTELQILQPIGRLPVRPPVEMGRLDHSVARESGSRAIPAIRTLARTRQVTGTLLRIHCPAPSRFRD